VQSLAFWPPAWGANVPAGHGTGRAEPRGQYEPAGKTSPVVLAWLTEAGPVAPKRQL
jgi:hypothetical protein